MVAWDAPPHYGIACKREDLRDPAVRSPFNSRPGMPDALRGVVKGVDAEVVLLSYNNESWLDFEALQDVCADRGALSVLAFDSPRYVGARIGIHNPAGERVGRVSHVRNTEYLVLAGPRRRIRAMAEAVTSAGLGRITDRPVPLVPA